MRKDHSILFCALVCTAALVGLSVSMANAEEWQPGNYDEHFVQPKNGVRLKDNNVWVYSSAFAKRFGMLARWIDNSLKGAEAVAYRVEWSSLQECGFFKDPNNCRPIERCILDVYLTDAQSKKLPWKNNEAQDFLHRTGSTRFLTAQAPQDVATWDPQTKVWDIYRAKIGLDSINWVSGPPREGKVFSGSSDGVSVLAYDKEIFAGLDYLQLAVDCGIATQKSKVRLFFTEKFPVPTDYGYRYVGSGLKASPEVEARFEEINKAWFEKYSKGDVPHIVALPDSYMTRVNAYDRTEYSLKSLATEAEKRMTDRKQK